MRALVIPDVHLKPEMFVKAAKILDAGRADRAVCLMDIPDDWKQELNLDLYTRTFDAAIKFAKDHPDTLWCYGNHDQSYVWRFLETGYSYFAESIVNSKLITLKRSLDSQDKIAYIHRIDNTLFLHGGLTNEFVMKHVDKDKRDDVDQVIRTINNLNEEIMWGIDSPMWFRPQSAPDPMYGSGKYIQVVGHTPVEQITREGNVISTDVFSLKRDRTPIGSRKFPVIDTQTGEVTEQIDIDV
ncbi:MAG: hypothetical protein J6127_04520 [Clostridiales bacterium]|nr:hypothetical protein [Clostridiales bacterium]